MDSDRIKELEDELRRVQTEFRMFYEITQAMRTTLNLDEVLYIILTGITARQGLGFNRAVLFFIDYNVRKFRGIMGIGPAEPQEAQTIWKWIEDEEKDLYDLIKEYNKIKSEDNKPKFFKLVESLELALSEEAGLIYEAYAEGMPLHVKKDNRPVNNDPLYKAFLFEEAVFLPLWAKNQIIAVLFVDNFITKKPITSQDLNILGMFASQAGLAIENSKLFEDTLFRSHTDSLTGLWNYGYFQYKLDEQIDYSLRTGKSLCLLMVDIDDFKMYNDAFGHLEGDRVLISVASTIKSACRKKDMVCRYGGEEFVVILPDIVKQDAYVIAERIRKSVEAQESSFQRKVTVSIGIGSLPEDCRDKNSLISKADTCLYTAKKEAKNKTVLS